MIRKIFSKLMHYTTIKEIFLNYVIPITQLNITKTKFEKLLKIKNKNKIIMIMSSTTRFFPAEFFTVKTRL